MLDGDLRCLFESVMETLHPLRVLSVLLLTGAGACGVGANISGQLGATAFGDVSNPPADSAGYKKSNCRSDAGEPPTAQALLLLHQTSDAQHCRYRRHGQFCKGRAHGLG